MERTMEGRSVVGVKGEVGQGCRSISKMRCFFMYRSGSHERCMFAYKCAERRGLLIQKSSEGRNGLIDLSGRMAALEMRCATRSKA